MTFFKATDSEMMHSVLSLADARNPMASRKSILSILVIRANKRRAVSA